MTRRPSSLAAVLAFSALVSCGKKGPPLAPLRPDPQPVTDLKVGQQGDTLVVSYVTPRLTIDAQGLDVHEIEILVADKPGDIAKVSRVVHRVQVAPGEARTETVPLPAGETVRVAARARFKGARSAPSRAVTVTVHPAPEMPSSVRAANDPAGVLVTWPTAVPSATPTPSPTATPTSTPTPTPTPLVGATPSAAPVLAATATPSPTPLSGYTIRRRPPVGAAVTLTTKPIAAPPYLDESPLASGTWCYTVARVVSSEPLVTSAYSPEGCVAVTDVRPPQPPTGLTLLATPGAFELAWSPSPDADVATYRVYRSEGGSEPQQVGERPPTERSFRDTTVERGKSYQFRVTAVDASGNESALSAHAEATSR